MNAKKHLQDMKRWNEQGVSWNFKHKLQFMETKDYLSGNVNLVKKLNENAIIESFRLNRFVNDLAGYFASKL